MGRRLSHFLRYNILSIQCRSKFHELSWAPCKASKIPMCYKKTSIDTAMYFLRLARCPNEAHEICYIIASASDWVVYLLEVCI